MAPTEARMTTSVLINRASAMRSSDTRRAHYIARIITAVMGGKLRNTIGQQFENLGWNN
jgi:hypothetical protein